MREIEAEIKSLGPAKPVNAKAQRMAEIAALFGADQVQAKAALTLLEPFLWTLFFEIGLIISLGFAFRHRPAIEIAATDRRQTSYPLETEPLRSLFSAGLPDAATEPENDPRRPASRRARLAARGQIRRLARPAAQGRRRGRRLQPPGQGRLAPVRADRPQPCRTARQGRYHRRRARCL